MPFLVRPPPEHAATDEYSHTYTIIEPDANDRTILRDLQHWGWLVSQHDFDDEDFIYALKGTEKDTRERKRNTHAVAGEMLSHRCKPTLEELWELEARRMLENTVYDEESNEALNNEHPLPVDGREESVVIDAEQEEDPRLQTAVKTWLKHIDRTRQTNGFLDYDDSQHEQPRLLIRRLDHSPTDAAYNPAYAMYADLNREHGRPPPP
ncbi:hypothetical protein BKA63DRAFT_569679 [Paraphoma chrysanthemicola]|nr:hypothetical protein BKA63DRAFT_569679 [Paraphoma chrysanthemicola]